MLFRVANAMVCLFSLPLLTFGWHLQPHRIYILGTCHVCMFWFRLNNICDNRQVSKDERFSETGREINKDIVAPKRLSQIPVVLEDCHIVRTAFHRFKL